MYSLQIIKTSLQEIRAIAGGEYNILSLSEIDCHDDIPETEATIEGNAMLKARWVKDKYGYDCFADDTGLEVTALGGRPGCTPLDMQATTAIRNATLTNCLANWLTKPTAQRVSAR